MGCGLLLVLNCRGRNAGRSARPDLRQGTSTLDPSRHWKLAALNEVDSICNAEVGRKEKCAPIIRGSIKRLWIRASSIQGLLIDLLYRCAVLAVCDSHFRRYRRDLTTETSIAGVASQPKHKLQGSVCADRASRSDDETGGNPADRACSNLLGFLLFRKPLKLT